jgi:flagellar basal-body rod modification protein FlgD
MAIGSVPSSLSPAAASAPQRIGLADDFDSFLKILTAQLRSQDPLAPLDANQFTQQLVQFSAVEQAIKTNASLAELVAQGRAEPLGRGLDLLGAEVVAAGATVRLGDGEPARFHYRVAEPAAALMLRIRDEAGNVVWQGSGAGSVGLHEVAWRGVDAAGRRLPDGHYRLEAEATGAGGAPVAIETTISGRVDGIELAGERLLLSIEGALVAMDAVRTVRARAPAPAI